MNTFNRIHQEEPQNSRPAFCKNCGNKISLGGKFCPKCGTPAAADTAAGRKNTSRSGRKKTAYDQAFTRKETLL